MAVVKFPREGFPDPHSQNSEIAEDGPPDKSDEPDREIMAAAAAALHPAKRARVQVRIPLEDPDELLLRLATLALATNRAIDAVKSSKRQRNPEVLDVMATVRGIYERTNKAINARRRHR
jgi:hypothetical protein